MRIVRGIAALSIVLAAFGAAAAANNFDVNVLWHPQPNDDVQVYLYASNVTYPAPREQVEAVFRQMSTPDQDYPVLAFIAHRAGVDIRRVWEYRQAKHSWSEVMSHFDVSPNALFVGELPHEPAPPYGKAWGHWRKNQSEMKTRQVKDDDVRFWVGIRTVAMYSGVSPAIALERHEAGERIPHIAGAHYRTSESGRNARNATGKNPQGKEKGKSK